MSFKRRTHAAAVLAAGLAAWTGAICARAEPSLTEPNMVLRDGRLYVEYHGDARNVQLLGDLLKDTDPLVRDRATAELGQTDNPSALPLLLTALQDTDPGVRCSALLAIGEIDANAARPLVVEKLADEDSRMVLAALRLTARSRFDAARPAVEKVLSSPRPLLASAALATMTELGWPAPTDALKGFLAPASPAAVRLRAAENALLSPSPLIDELLRAAKEGPSHVRAAAMAALGKADFTSVEPIVTEVAKGPDPVLRRGALWACRHAGKSDRIRPFLDDESPMVLLAAIQAADELKAADCIDRLMEVLSSVRDDQAHFAARAALANMGQQRVTELAAVALRAIEQNLSHAVKGASEQRDATVAPASGSKAAGGVVMLHRNARSYSWLLGQYRDPRAVEVQLRLVKSLPLDSPTLIDMAGALGRIGDPRAGDVIRDALKICADRAPAYLTVMEVGSGSHPPFSESVTGALVRAAGDLKAVQAVPQIIRLVEATSRGKSMKLTESAASAARALPLLADDTNRPAIENAILVILRDHRAHGRECTFTVCKTAAGMKLTAAVPHLETILSERNGRQLIAVSAWAIGQITGKTPDLPEPMRNQGQWIATVLER